MMGPVVEDMEPDLNELVIIKLTSGPDSKKFISTTIGPFKYSDAKKWLSSHHFKHNKSGMDWDFWIGPPNGTIFYEQDYVLIPAIQAWLSALRNPETIRFRT